MFPEASRLILCCRIQELLEGYGAERVEVLHSGIFDTIREREQAKGFPLFGRSGASAESMGELIRKYGLDRIPTEALKLSLRSGIGLKRARIESVAELLLMSPGG